MSMEVNFLHLVTVDSQMKITIFGILWHVLWWRGAGVRKTLFATIRVEDEGIKLVSNDTSLPDYTVLHSTRSSSSFTFLPNSNPSGLPQDHMQRQQLHRDATSLGMEF
jgi:hypothetical protein